MKKRFLWPLIRRRVFVCFLILLQFALVVFFLLNRSRNSTWISGALNIASIFVVLYLVNKYERGEYRLIWSILILMFPLFGGLFYLLFKYQSASGRFPRRLMDLQEAGRPLMLYPGDCLEGACAEAPEYAAQMRYLQNFAGFPVYEHTKTEYLTPGEAKHQRLLQAMRDAQKYIFLEYFIIKEGDMWDPILVILREKAAQGLDVRVMYDDMGCFFLLPEDYPKRLEAMGIRCTVFSPFQPVLTVKQNNRNHRKIAVIDGKIAITGGVNLSDEYINAVNVHGHWKDASILLEGCAAWSLTLMFLQMWAACTNDKEDFSEFYPWAADGCGVRQDGLVQPYADSPMDQERVCKNVYMQIISGAKRYVYINTPYLIIDDSMVSALKLAAKCGVDVRIVTPQSGDKWYAHMTTRSYYRELIREGVKIYEYSKGFLHSKTFVSDDSVATVGSANMDFRSLYLHFECGVWMYKSKAVTQVRDDFVETLEHCRQITERDCVGHPMIRFIQDTLRLLAPLL